MANLLDEQPGNTRKQLVQGLKRGSIGLEMGVSVLVGYLLGSWLDEKMETQPWLTLVCLLLGVAAGFNALFQLAKRVSKEDQDTVEDGDDEGGSGSVME